MPVQTVFLVINVIQIVIKIVKVNEIVTCKSWCITNKLLHGFMQYIKRKDTSILHKLLNMYDIMKTKLT